MFKGLLKLLPLIIHEIAEVIIEKIKERRERKVEQQKTDLNEKS